MQDSISVRTPAKINLSLDIIGRRNDGYHFVRTIMQSVSMFDYINVKTNEENAIRVFCDYPDIPTDESNLVFHAATEFFKHIGCEPSGIDIVIKKTIPPLAGLAGGSTNAAGMLVALNELMETELSVDELCGIGARIGSDVPFCISGSTMLAEGVGDILSPLPNLPECYFVVVKPSINISTVEAFAKYDAIPNKKSAELNDFIASLAAQDIHKVSSYLFNALEYASDHFEILRIKEELMSFGALGALMTGSGSAVYGIFEKKKTATKAADDLSEIYDFVEVCTPLTTGCEVVEKF